MQVQQDPIFQRANDIMAAVYNRFAEQLFYPQEVVYHYTSLPAAHMILKNRELWLANALTMNDPSEIRYAHQMVLEIEKKRSAINEQRAYIESVFGFLGNSASTCYLSSFSSIANSLSQWRAYSYHPQGVCLAFSAAALSSIAPEARLVRVVYEKQLQEMILSFALDKLAPELGAVAEAKEANEPVIAEAMLIIIFVLLHFFQILKHPDYEVESEWRLISSGLMASHSKEIRFETIGNRVRPIVAVPLNPLANFIKEIKIGPGTDENLHEIVRLLVYKYLGSSETIQVNTSDTPLRQ